MKRLDDFMTQLRHLGVKLWVEGDRLKLRAREGAVTPALTAELRARKPEILALLSPAHAYSIEPVDAQDSYELSPSQRRLWVLSQLEEGSAAYSIPLHQLLDGPLDREALQTSLRRLVQRHQSLRTTYMTVDGEPRQVIHDDVDVAMELTDLTTHEDPEEAARSLGRRETVRPFNLETGPLLRTSLLKLAEQRHVLLFTIHHIIADGVSLGVLSRDLSQLYQSAHTGQPDGLPELTFGYPAYAIWQNRLLGSQQIAVHRQYWHHKLAGELPVLNLPTDFLRPPVQTFNGEELSFTLDAAQQEALLEFCHLRNASLFIGLLTTLKVLLYAYTGQQDIIVGSPVAGREHAELDNQIGFYLNTLVLRDRIRPDTSFENFFQQVKQTATEALDHQIYPLDRLVDELDVRRDLSRSALFEVALIVQNQFEPGLSLDEVRATSFFEHPKTSKFDLTFCFKQTRAGLILAIEYNSDLFREDRIRRMGEHFFELINSILDNPSQSVGGLNLLSKRESRRLVHDFNDTATAYPRDKTVVDLLEHAAERWPDTVALVCGEVCLTYQQLHAKSNQLARHLRSMGVGPEVPVGICVQRSPQMVVGLLGVLKAGGAYVPLDPAFPRDRLAFILEDSKATVLVTQSSLNHVVAMDGVRLIELDADWNSVSESSSLPPAIELRPDHLAYVIYTSGSTGQPKGVEISHRALVNFLVSMMHRPGLTQRDVLLAVTSLSFDISGLEIYLPLIQGARLVLAKDEVAADGGQLASLLHSSGATIMQATPATWRLLLASGWKGERRLKILCGGEAFPRQLAAQLVAKGHSVWNMYGPTETTIWSTIYELKPQAAGGDDAVESIGRPIANTQIFILDRSLQPVPIGVPGELCIAGEGLARGYFNRRGLTAEKFIPHPFINDPNRRMYRTGDLVRYRSDGNIEFLSRIDQQVKIRGYRIELDEIESVLSTYPGVLESVVIAQPDKSGEKRLVAYFVGTQSENVSVSELAKHVRLKLPEYFVPGVFQRVDALPLMPNGKVNRRALPVPDLDRPDLDAEYMPPRNEIERRITALWQEVLDFRQVGIHDSFFELGGHSLKATRLIARIERDLGIRFSLLDFFQHPTVAGLASLADSRAKSCYKQIEGATDSLAITTSSAESQSIAPLTDEEMELLRD